MASRALIGRFLLIAALAAPLPARAQDAAELLAQSAKHFERNEYAAAISVLQAIPETADTKSRIRKHLGIANALMNIGRDGEALPYVEQGRKIAREAGDIAGQANAEIAWGNYLISARQRGDAIAAFERAVALATQSGNRGVLAEAYNRLSTGYQLLEDWARAMHYSDRGFELRDNPSLIVRFNRQMDRGIAYFEMYDRDAAEREFREGLALAIESGGKRNEGFAVGELGFVYWTFDRDKARALEYYDRAITLTAEAKAPDNEVTWRLNRGNVYRDSGDYARALEEYAGVVELEKAYKFTRVSFAANKNIGQTYRLMGRLDDALAQLEPLVRDRPGNPSPRHMWQAHMELASTYEALGRRSEAQTHYAATMEVIEEQRNTSIFDAFRTGTFAHTLSAYDPYERYIRFLSSDPARAEEALLISEKARARSFLEMLASVRSALTTTVPAELLAEEGRIMRAISGVQTQLRAADLPRTRRDALLAELSQHEKARDAFRLKLRVQHPALSETRYPDVAGARALQPSIRAGETVLSFYLSEPDSFRWTLTRDGMRSDRIASRQRIEAQTARLRQLLRAPGDIAAARAEADALAALLLAGLDLPAGSPLVVVPHGVLHYVPFEVLTARGRLLIEDHPVSYAPSINALAFLRRTEADRGQLRVLAVGAPVVHAGTVAAARDGDIGNVALLGPLPFAAEEINAIKRVFSSAAQTLIGADARETALRRPDLAAFQVLHFATHGVISDTHPARSALLFSPEAGEDGLLQMGEIYRLGLRSDLVVLSACRTALGRDITGEGIVGLTRAFFHGGSRAVMATLWNLNDRFAADFVERFYKELGRGRTSEDALRAAKLAFLNDARYAHPFYWSSMIVTGDATRALSVSRPRWHTYAAAIGILVVVFAAGAGMTARRRRAAQAALVTARH